MIFKDYYKILGLKNNNVTAEEIKQAYREQAKNITLILILQVTLQKKDLKI